MANSAGGNPWNYAECKWHDGSSGWFRLDHSSILEFPAVNNSEERTPYFPTVPVQNGQLKRKER